MVSTMCPFADALPRKEDPLVQYQQFQRYITALALCHEHGPVAGKIGSEKPMRKIFRGEDPESRRYRSGG